MQDPRWKHDYLEFPKPLEMLMMMMMKVTNI